MEHYRSFHPDQEYKCDVCGREFSRKNSLLRHIFVHAGEKPYKCEICEARFRLSTHLKNHLWTHAGKSPYTGDVCNKPFNQSSALKLHKMMHTGEKPHTCKICGKRFNQIASLSLHLLSHKIADHECKICKKRYAYPGTLKCHMLLHIGKKGYKCKMCSKVFSHPGKLRTHERSHSRSKSFKCEICEKSFTQKGNLGAHIRNVHVQANVLTCVVCKKQFFTDFNLQKHMQRSHAKKNGKFRSDFCDKSVTSAISLNRHFCKNKPPQTTSEVRLTNKTKSENTSIGCKVDQNLVELTVQEVTDKPKLNIIYKNYKNGSESVDECNKDPKSVIPRRCYIEAVNKSSITDSKTSKIIIRKNYKCGVAKCENHYKSEMCTEDCVIFNDSNDIILSTEESEKLIDENEPKVANRVDENNKNNCKVKRTFICDFCSENFTNTGDLILHYLKHKKDIISDLKGQSASSNMFDESSTVEIKMNQRIDSTKYKYRRTIDLTKDNYRCNFCGKYFIREKTLHRHLFISHKIIANLAKRKSRRVQSKPASKIGAPVLKTNKTKKAFDKRQYICRSCKKQFHFACRLKQHLDMNNCCNKRTDDKVDVVLKTNETRLFRKKRHVCHGCKKKFRYAWRLKQHQDKNNCCNKQTDDIVEVVSKTNEAIPKTNETRLFHKKRHICHGCKKQFRWPSWLKQHQENSNCCNKRTDDKVEAIPKMNPTEACCKEKWVCNCCQRQFRWPSWLKKHQDSTKSCSKQTDDKVVSEEAVVSKKHTCEYCKLEFLSMFSLEQHQNGSCKERFLQEVNTELYETICDVSKNDFPSALYLEEQLISNIDVADDAIPKTNETQVYHKKQYICHGCKKQFPFACRLKQHQDSTKSCSKQTDDKVVSEEDVVTKKHTCEYCKLEFLSMFSLEQHQNGSCKERSLQEDDSELYETVCDVSKNDFPTAPYLEKQLLSNIDVADDALPKTNETQVFHKKRHVCHGCKKEFPFACRLKQHQNMNNRCNKRTVISKTNDAIPNTYKTRVFHKKRHVCHGCKKKFRYAWRLKQHQDKNNCYNKQTEDKVESEEAVILKKHPCEHCKLDFLSAFCLEQHQNGGCNKNSNNPDVLQIDKRICDFSQGMFLSATDEVVSKTDESVSKTDESVSKTIEAIPKMNPTEAYQRKKWVCSCCKRQFRWPSWLKQHQDSTKSCSKQTDDKVVSEEAVVSKKHTCEYCNLEFLCTFSLEQHQSGCCNKKSLPHVLETDKYVCDVCHKEFSTASNLEKHRPACCHHRQLEESEAHEKPTVSHNHKSFDGATSQEEPVVILYKCSLCTETFDALDGFKLHVSIHFFDDLLANRREGRKSHMIRRIIPDENCS